MNELTDIKMNAIMIFLEVMNNSENDIEKVKVIFTACLVLCMDNIDDEEEMIDALKRINKNCATMWIEYKNLKNQYGI